MSNSPAPSLVPGPQGPRVPLLTGPTPVGPLHQGPGARLWLKNDGLSHPEYGGNKIRKLERVLAAALEGGARRLVTFGAAGSHHVLATTLFGRHVGLPTAAVLLPQPGTAHARETLRAALAQGLEAHPCADLARVPLALARLARRGDHVIPPGASDVAGTLAYAEAIPELAEQLPAAEHRHLERLVAPLGSGGTVAGLLAGVVHHRLPWRVTGVTVALPAMAARAEVLTLAWATLRALRSPASRRDLVLALSIDGDQRGPGYGSPTAAGDAATARAHGWGLTLDPTYTAKTLAHALVEAEGAPRVTRPHRSLLYWHTLSAVPLGPLLVGAPELPPALDALLRNPADAGSRPGSPSGSSHRGAGPG